MRKYPCVVAAVAVALLALSGTHASATEATPLRYKLEVIPEIKKAFAGCDAIEIREVTGTAPRFQVDGTYRVVGVCRQRTIKNATLYIGNTADPGSEAISAIDGSSLYQTCSGDATEFDVTFKVLRPGVLHATIYDLANKSKDNAYAGLYLGTATPQSLVCQRHIDGKMTESLGEG